MRGKVTCDLACFLHPGITPAYAGKSTAGASPRCRFWDHPRLCGEKVNFDTKIDASGGSPPPMRGKDFQPLSAQLCTRITPAYAGKSTVSSVFPLRPEDHPRLCGEKLLPVVFAVKCEGSPPPMRGKARFLRKTKILRRITPAYAGKR